MPKHLLEDISWGKLQHSLLCNATINFSSFSNFSSTLPSPSSLSLTDESSVGSKAEACWVFETAAGSHRRWLAVIKKISQSGPGNNTNNNSHQTQEMSRKFGWLRMSVCVFSDTSHKYWHILVVSTFCLFSVISSLFSCCLCFFPLMGDSFVLLKSNIWLFF